MRRTIILIQLMAALSVSLFAGGTTEEQEPEIIITEKSFPMPAAEENSDWIGGPGVLVSDVLADSPASEAGIKRGDIILEIEGIEVNSVYEIRDILSGYNAGDIVSVLLSRGDETLTITLELENRLYHPPIGIATAHIRGQDRAGNFQFREMQSFGNEMMPDGVIILRVEEGSPADSAGLNRGDIITHVGNEPVVGDNLQAIIMDLSPGDSVTLKVLRFQSGELRDSRLWEEEDVDVTLSETEDGRPYLGVGFFSIPRAGGRRQEPMVPGRRPDTLEYQLKPEVTS